MATIRWRAWLVVPVAMAVSWSGSATAGQSPAQRCEARKNLAVGAKAECVAGEYARKAQGGTPNFERCETALTKAFEAAERQARPGGCPTEGDTAAIEAMVDTCMGDIAAALAGNCPSPPCPPAQLPATGQTRCWNSAGTVIPCAGTGQDGAVRAGRALGYTDNGDGTITDNTTGVMWEKKSTDGLITDKDKTYTWEGAFTGHIAALNSGAGFLGYTDWRVPNVKELLSIVNYEHSNPAVSPAFNTGCTSGCSRLECSCTVAAGYWSSTTVARGAPLAWFVNFLDGDAPPERDRLQGQPPASRASGPGWLVIEPPLQA